MCTKEAIDFILDLNKKGLGRNQILQKLNWSSKKLTNFCYNNKLEISKSNNLDISEEQKQVIIGSLLGDGCISYSGKYSKNCRLQITHSMKQLEYLNYKYTIIKTLCNNNIVVRNRTDNRFKDPNYTVCEIKTKSLSIFSNYRNTWYKEGKKDLQNSNVNEIEPLGLAIWFMDDGYISGKSFLLATQSFYKKDLELLKKILKDKFNIETVLRKNGEIYIRTKSSKEFVNLIKPYIVKQLYYKISLHLKPGEFRETPEVDNPEPSPNLNVLERCND